MFYKGPRVGSVRRIDKNYDFTVVSDLAGKEPYRNIPKTHSKKVHHISNDGTTQPFGIKVKISENDRIDRIVYFGGIAGSISAIQRFVDSDFYKKKGTKLYVYIAENWMANVNASMDQPWGQEINSLSPPTRAKAKKIYPDRKNSDRVSIKEYGELQNLQVQDLEYLINSKQLNVDITRCHKIERIRCDVQYRNSKKNKYQPMITIKMGDAYREIPYDGTLIINNAFSYGKLTTGNHDLIDSQSHPLEFEQGTALFSTSHDKLHPTMACVGFGLTYLWAASKLKQDGINLICLYDKNYSPFNTVKDLIEANAANEWIKELPQNVLNELEVFSIQDCTINLDSKNEYEVILPNGKVHNIGKKLYDLTGYTYVPELTQNLPDELVYRPNDAGVFAFATDDMRREIEQILFDSSNLTEEEKNDFFQLIEMIKFSHQLKESLRSKNEHLSLKEFLATEKKLVKNHNEIRAFTKKKGGAILDIFNRYESDSYQTHYLQHVPHGSAPSTYVLAAQQFGHIPNLGLFESHLIRNSHLFEIVSQEFKDITNCELTAELFSKYIIKLNDYAIHEKHSIHHLNLSHRTKAFKEAVIELYPNIEKDKLENFCQVQSSYYKNAEALSLVHDEVSPGTRSYANAVAIYEGRKNQVIRL